MKKLYRKHYGTIDSRKFNTYSNPTRRITCFFGDPKGLIDDPQKWSFWWSQGLIGDTQILKKSNFDQIFFQLWWSLKIIFKMCINFRFPIPDYRSDTCIIDFSNSFKNFISADFYSQIHVIQNNIHFDWRFCWVQK